MANVLDPHTKKELEEFITLKSQTDNGFNQRSMANALGIAQSTLSALRSDTYTGNIIKMKNKIVNYLQREKDKTDSPKREMPFIRTRAAENIFNIARQCHLDGEIGVVTGDAGFGKTVALKEYAKKYSDTILVEADLGYSARILFRELLREVNIELFAHLHDMFDAFVNKVRGTGKLIIVDEAEHLPYKALELVRRINDKAHVGVLLVGMPILLNNLMGKKQQYRQLYSRVSAYYQLDKLDEADTKKLVDQMFPNNNGIHKDFYAETKGNARTLSKLIGHVDRVIKHNRKRSIDKNLISKLSKLLISY